MMQVLSDVPISAQVLALGVAEQRGLEGVVASAATPYRSGECREWLKVKTTIWREANRKRWRLRGGPLSRLRSGPSTSVKLFRHCNYPSRHS
jgi:hypothetical protein